MSSGRNPTAMVVEDVFTVTGRGIVVTGYPATDVRRGARVEICRGGQLVATATVSALEMFKPCFVPPETPRPTGILLQGITADMVRRGDELRLLPAEEIR